MALVVGHRANTPRWIRRYLREGADGLEVDVYQRGKSIYVSHVMPSRRPRLLRERVADFLASLHVTPAHRLRDLVRLIPKDMALIVDLKTRVEPAALREEIEFSGRDPPEVFISTRWHVDAPRLREHGFHVLLSLDNRPSSLAKLLDDAAHADGVSINHVYVDEDLVREARSVGWIVAAWSVNQPDEAERLQRLGIDMIVTDFPGDVGRRVKGSQHKA
jgi:glycerophosphoryl diester phosphodiesterase